MNEDSWRCLKHAEKHRATFMSQNTDTSSDAVDASLEEMIHKKELHDGF